MGASNGNASTRCSCASPTERKACAERQCHLRGDAGRCAAAAGTGNQAESDDSGGGLRCGRAAVCSIPHPWPQRHQRVFAPCRLRQRPARGMSRPLPSSRPPPAAGRAPTSARSSPRTRPGSTIPVESQMTRQLASINRQISGPKALKRPTGYECYEYPFASTTMGGGKTAPADRYVGWVPAAENHLQGGLLSTFFSTDRVFPAFTYGGQGDPFYVYV
jgi:hypothetical protein